MTTEKLYHHNKVVQLTELRCFSYGRKRGYKVIAEYDGIPMPAFEAFWELDSMLEMAGYGKPEFQHGKHIPLPDINTRS